MGLVHQKYFDGFEYIAKAKYVPSGPGELRLNKEDKVKVLKLSDDESSAFVERLNEARFASKRSQAKGWVPFVLIAQIGSIEAEPFYAGPMSRVDAGDLIRKHSATNKQGNFVLRKNLRTLLYR